MKLTLILLATMITGSSAFAAIVKVERSLASIQHNIRVEHARELLGTGYKKSIYGKNKDMEKNILASVKERLPKAYKSQANTIASAIIQEAGKHNLDPYFVMAVVSGESSFNPLAKGPVGEIGLMQIRPSTGEWMAKLTKFKWKGERTLRDPVSNIKLGTAYLAWLRVKFDGQGQLYLAAYNMGPKSVQNAVGKNVWPKDYPIHVMKRYIAFYKEVHTN